MTEHPSPVSLVKQRFNICPDTVRQALLLLAILKELLYLLVSLSRGSLSLQDAYDRLNASQVDYHASADEMEVDSPTSTSKSLDSEGTVAGDSVDGESKPVGLVTPVHVLCRSIVQQDFKLVSRMLEIAPRLVAKRHEDGWYPLHAAVLSGDIEMVKLILSQPKVDVNAVYKEYSSTPPEVRESELGTSVNDTGGATALHYACMVGDTEIIRLLVEHGAKLNANDDKKREPSDYFDIQKHLEAMSVFHELYLQWKQRDDFYKVYKDVDDFIDLIREDEYETFERCIKKNPSIVSRFTDSDFTLFHLAVAHRRRHFVELLISIDKSVVNKLDRRYSWSCGNDNFGPQNMPFQHVKKATPLHYACLVHDVDITRMLLEAGADWTIKDRAGRTPEELIYALDAECEELKALFVKFRGMDEERKEEAEGEFGVDEIDESDDDDYVHSDRQERQNSNSPEKLSAESLLALETTLAEKLVGQQGPIRVVANAIRLRESGWIDPDRPLTMLFLGSSGVGKTELAKQLALYIHGKDGLATNKGESIRALEKGHGFVRLDMSEFQESHTVMNLIGAPKSYVGYGDGGALTQSLKKNPRAVVLLDEIEKAHPEVLTAFLQVFDDGRITDSKDGTINCKDAIFIMTSNIAADEIKEKAPILRQFVAQSEEEGQPGIYVHLIRDFTRSLHPELKRHLRRDEFIGRINQIVVFLPLGQEEIELTVQRELAMWCKRAEEKNKIAMTWTEDVVRKLSSVYDVNYGVRSVANEVQRVAVQLIAEAHIRGQISSGSKASLMTNEVGDIVMNVYNGDASMGEVKPDNAMEIVDTKDAQVAMDVEDNKDATGE